jgi:hypothetical protein
MLGQGIDLIQCLAGTRQLPVAFEFGLMKQRPLENEPRRSGGQRALDKRAIKRDRRLSITVPGVEGGCPEPRGISGGGPGVIVTQL